MSTRRDDVYRLMYFRHESLRAGHPAAEVPTVLGYRPADPWAITARFFNPSQPYADRAWTFGRELLAAGLDASTDTPAGEGDVQISSAGDPAGRWVRLTLTVDAVSARLLIEREHVARFIAATEQRVRLGDEAAHIDVDALVNALRRA